VAPRRASATNTTNTTRNPAQAAQHRRRPLANNRLVFSTCERQGRSTADRERLSATATRPSRNSRCRSSSVRRPRLMSGSSSILRWASSLVLTILIPSPTTSPGRGINLSDLPLGIPEDRRSRRLSRAVMPRFRKDGRGRKGPGEGGEAEGAMARYVRRLGPILAATGRTRRPRGNRRAVAARFRYRPSAEAHPRSFKDAVKAWCCWRGLNSRPLPYQGSALPLSYSSARGHQAAPS
jgi:hypothetical protein